MARCGGVDLCPRCKAEVQDHIEQMTGSHVNYQQHAIDILRDHLRPRDFEGTPAYTIYIIWFTKTLQHWKAILGTTLDDCMIYELTHNGDKRETYLDGYHKVENRAIPD
jgi:hypothetical protein